MELIFGGAYQGKTQYAAEKYHCKDEEIFTCEGEALDLTARCLRHLERFAELSRMEMLLQEYTGQEPEKKLLSDKEFEVFYKDLAACIDRHKALQEQKTAVHAAAERLSEPSPRRSCGRWGTRAWIFTFTARTKRLRPPWRRTQTCV